jgi:hypothetical protein
MIFIPKEEKFFDLLKNWWAESKPGHALPGTGGAAAYEEAG